MVYTYFVGRPRIRRNLSRDDIGNQGRYLLGRFVHDRLVADGHIDAPEINHLIEPGTPTGRSLLFPCIYPRVLPGADSSLKSISTMPGLIQLANCRLRELTVPMMNDR